MMSKIINVFNKNVVLKSSVGLLIITLFVKILGYGEKLILAYFYGTSYKVDAYTVVITAILSLALLFKEIIEPGFLNVFMKARSKGDEKGAWNLFNIGIRSILIITIIITIITMAFPGKVIHIFAPGFHDNKFILATKLIQIAIPASIFLAIAALTNITLNSLKIFALPASGEIAFKGFIILFLVALYQFLGITGAAIGIVAGAMGKLSVHLIKLYKHINFKSKLLNKEYLENVWVLTWPLLIGVVFSQLVVIIGNIFASYLQEGAIAAISYSKKIVELPIVIFPTILGIVVFPYFSQLAIEKDQQRLSFLLSESFRWLAIAFIPVSAFFFIYAFPIIEIIFQRGAFNADSTLLTSRPLAVYSVGMLFFAIETIVVFFYFANADTKTPVFVGIGCAILNIVSTWILIHYIGYIGIALGYVIQKTVKTIILLVLLKRKIQFNNNKIIAFISRVILSAIVFVTVIFLLKIFLFNDHLKLIVKIGVLTISFLIGCSIYLGLLHLMGELKVKNRNSLG
jgi:putative peptidoglycan lipid II flippase